jgi:type IV secretory pathway VirB6-like protein
MSMRISGNRDGGFLKPLRDVYGAVFIVLVLLAGIMGGTHNAYAQAKKDPTYAKDDSCFISPEGGDNLVQKTLAIAVTAGVAGAYAGVGAGALVAQTIVDGFRITGTNKDTNGPLNDCSVASNTITFCYDPIAGAGTGIRVSHLASHIGNIALNLLIGKADKEDWKWSVLDDNTQDCSGNQLHTWYAGQENNFHGSYFRAVHIADKICIQLHSGVMGWITMGCRFRIVPPSSLPQTCFVGPSCTRGVHQYSKALLSISGMVVQCFKESLSKIFDNTNLCQEAIVDSNGVIQYDAKGNPRYRNTEGDRTNLFHGFKNSLRRATTAALTLYVIFFSIKVVLGQKVPQKGEIFMFILKMSLVIYFSMGDGIKNDIYPAFVGAGTSLSQMFMSAGGTQTLCNYTNHTYEENGVTVAGFLNRNKIPPYPEGHSDMALWDALDCRVGHYLGFFNKVGSSKDYQGALDVSTFLAAPVMILSFVSLIIGLQLVAALATLMFGILFLSIVVFVVHTYLVALIGMTVVMYVAPLFVPMALFKQTKGYFDGWVKVLVTFTLQPIVLFAFLGIMITTFDRIYYSVCPFKTETFSITYPPKLGDAVRDSNGVLQKDPTTGAQLYSPPTRVIEKIPIFYIDEDRVQELPPKERAACTETMGYSIFNASHNIEERKLDLGFFSVPYYRVNIVNKNIFPLLLFCFLFYFLAMEVSNVAADLIGIFTVGTNKFARDARAIADKAMSKTTSLLLDKKK